jgi:nanoRNase/pAp phosphatase (c-di-AMP/oligoRNAs hydrolase)
MPDLNYIIQQISRYMKLVGKRHLFIQTHDIPDPDAIASAEAFRIIAKRFNVKASLVANGLPFRRENRTLLMECMISFRSLDAINIADPSQYAWAFIDCLPGGGNLTLHPQAPGDLYMAIDHHGHSHIASKYPTDFMIIEPDVGATATLLGEVLIEIGIPIQSKLASAMSYAIISDTQDFSRGASKNDLDVYASIFPHTDQHIISRIRNTRKSRKYFRTVYRCLENTYTYRTIAWTWLGAVESGEIVAEMADFVLSLEGITWSLAMGHTQDRMFLSLRSSNPHASCAKLIRKLVPFSPFTVGGHDQFAGGFILIDRVDDIDEMAGFLTERFIRHVLHTPASLPIPKGMPLVRQNGTETQKGKPFENIKGE